MLAASAATAPNVSVRSLASWVTALKRATHSAAGTFQRAAAAPISISRAMAPACRNASWENAIDRLAPVDKSPQSSRRRRFSAGATSSVRTVDQSHSSSSATSMARPVIAPCPISELAMRMTTVLSGWITIQAVISVLSLSSPGTGGEGAVAEAAANGMAKPRASPPPTALIPASKRRRLSASPEVFGFFLISMQPRQVRVGVQRGMALV